jgi:hypothetical protein
MERKWYDCNVSVDSRGEGSVQTNRSAGSVLFPLAFSLYPYHFVHALKTEVENESEMLVTVYEAEVSILRLLSELIVNLYLHVLPLYAL